jgi:hypothetical protein
LREIAGKSDQIAGRLDSDDTPPAAEWHAGLKTAKIVIANHLHGGIVKAARKPITNHQSVVRRAAGANRLVPDYPGPLDFVLTEA